MSLCTYIKTNFTGPIGIYVYSIYLLALWEKNPSQWRKYLDSFQYLTNLSIKKCILLINFEHNYYVKYLICNIHKICKLLSQNGEIGYCKRIGVNIIIKKGKSENKK